MTTCIECKKPIPYGMSFGGSICHSCRGKRAAAVKRAKREKHGAAYFDRRSSDARSPHI